MAKITKVTPVGGNVFSDLGLADAEELGTKARLGSAIHRILMSRRLPQAEAAKLLGVNQPKISALLNFKLEGFSVERLMHFLTVLEHDVVIHIAPRRKAVARVSVKSKNLPTQSLRKTRATA